MIVDITNEILTDIKNELTDVTVLSSFQPSTPSFPTVIVEEIINTDDVSTKDSSGFTHANISYSVEIYTTGSAKMTEAKDIRGRVNNVISSKYGLARGMSAPVPNYLDGDIYRYRLTYSGKINKNKKIYRG